MGARQPTTNRLRLGSSVVAAPQAEHVSSPATQLLREPGEVAARPQGAEAAADAKVRRTREQHARSVAALPHCQAIHHPPEETTRGVQPAEDDASLA